MNGLCGRPDAGRKKSQTPSGMAVGPNHSLNNDDIRYMLLLLLSDLRFEWPHERED